METVVIPEITHPLGRHWDAPDRKEVYIHSIGRSGKYQALMKREAFNKLLDYSRSQPTGVYEGKMWKSSDDKITWYLHWWVQHPSESNMCSGMVAEIVITD